MRLSSPGSSLSPPLKRSVSTIEAWSYPLNPNYRNILSSCATASATSGFERTAQMTTLVFGKTIEPDVCGSPDLARMTRCSEGKTL